MNQNHGHCEGGNCHNSCSSPGWDVTDLNWVTATIITKPCRELRGTWPLDITVNFDSGFAADINVVFPIDRLEELAEDAVIGDVADNHYAFAGNQSVTVSEIRLDSGPHCAREMLDEGVDVVLLTGT